MNHLKTLVLLLAATLFSSAFAAEPTTSVHWYHIVIDDGRSTTTFTGSAPFDATEMPTRLTKNTEPVALENRRGQFASEKPKLEYGWHPLDPGSKVFILPRTVLYFVSLPGDPAAAPK